MKKLTILLFALVLTVCAQAQAHKYYAGFIYNFTRNMNWDASRQSGDFVIAVVGDSPVTQYLEQMAATKTVGTQKIIIRKVSSASAASGAHVIFLPSGQSSQLSSAIGVANSSKALLVTEASGLARKGAAMNFVQDNGKVGFEINKRALSTAKIQINSKLESLGKIVG